VAALLIVVLLVVLIIVYRRRRSHSVGIYIQDSGTVEFQSVQALVKTYAQPYEIDRRSITLEKEIGQGEFGVVMKALGVKLPGCDEAQSVAVKVLKHTQSESDVNAFVREGLRLRELNHANVVRLIGVCLDEEPYMIVLEYMPFGDLKTQLRRCKANNIDLGLSHLMSFVLDIARGFDYLQQQDFVHRDLAARNVLINAAFTAKIGDFGKALVIVIPADVAQAWRAACTTASTTLQAARR
jgi:serine/threonine protein kinase